VVPKEIPDKLSRNATIRKGSISSFSEAGSKSPTRMMISKKKTTSMGFSNKGEETSVR
jgi:hypothetical protein